MKKILIAAIALSAAVGVSAKPIENDSLIALQKQNQYTELWGQRATLFNTLGCDSTDIVMLGNSLIQGGEWAQMTDINNIINRGIIGDIGQGIIDRIDCVVDGKPAKIFLECGANDISHDVAPDSIVRVIGRIIDIIQERSPRTEIYVHSLLPINNSFGRYKRLIDKEEDIRQTNKLLKPMVESKGATYINLYPYLCDNNSNLRKDLTNDGLHLRGEGYEIWLEKIMPYLKPRVNCTNCGCK